jgi:hypothetical protein
MVNYGAADRRPVTLERLVTTPAVVAFVLIDALSVGAEWYLSFLAPERSIVATLNGRVPLRGNKHSFPAEVRATIVVDASESWMLHTYTLAPVAVSSARFTATVASFTL